MKTIPAIRGTFKRRKETPTLPADFDADRFLCYTFGRKHIADNGTAGVVQW
jgi:hypothetical protein